MDEIENPAIVVVSDAGPLIHLDQLGCLDLLSDFQQVLIAPTVWEEVERHRPSALVDARIPLKRTTFDSGFGQEVSAVGRIFTLHRGEREALQIAVEMDADLFLTDDTAARLAAKDIEIPVHGAIGILLRAIRRGQRSRDEILAVLRALPSLSTLHLKRTLLEEVIERVERTE